MLKLTSGHKPNQLGFSLIMLALISSLVWSFEVLANLSVPNPFSSEQSDEKTITEGPLSKAVLIAGPFDIHRHYRSMEGPWVTLDFKPGEVLNQGNITCPEGMVNFAEKGAAPVSMMGAAKAAAKEAAPVAQKPLDSQVKGMVPVKGPRELYWFKGVKLEVLDENDKVLPTAEFICHWNLDVQPDWRNRTFTEGHYCQNPRLSSVSQGETTQILPPGYGVPVASDEPITASFQAANRTTDLHRRLKHRCTLYFVKDIDLVYPIKALYWYVPYMTVVVDHNTPDLSKIQQVNCPLCVGASDGVDAPNDRAGGVFSDKAGHRLSGHWVVPPGVHTYHDVIGPDRDDGFNKGNPIIRALWTHVHPLCTRFSLIESLPEGRRTLFTAHCQTKTKPGLQIMHLDFLTPKDGIQLRQDAAYEMEVTYNNPFPVAYDSMASMGLYMEDPMFVRPKWALHDYIPSADQNSLDQQQKQSAMSCAIPNAALVHGMHAMAGGKAEAPADEPAQIDRKALPLFDPNKDGPLLSKDQLVELTTSEGPIDIKLEPKLAPQTATHIFTLMKNGSYAGTPFHKYDSDNYFMLAPAPNKLDGFDALTREQIGKLRRLPLEASGSGKHEALALELTRDHDETNSGTSSFCIFLNEAQHLDGKYTIFGHVVANERSLATLNKLKEHWYKASEREHIISSSVNK